MKKKPDRGPRIVSLAPSATSILCEIGAGDLLVGVTRWCADVAPVGHLPTLGDCWRIESVEQIAKLRPTLVVGSVPFKGETIEKILKEPVTFLALNPRTLADIESDIELLARVVGRVPGGRRAVNRMRSGFQKIARRSRGRRLRVYCEAWPNPRISSPPWVAEVAEICGAHMVVEAGRQVDEEEVRRGRPEAMILAWAATGARALPQKAYDVKAWRDVPAIRNRRVFVVRDELLNTPAPVLLGGAAELEGIFRKISKESGKNGDR